MFGVRVFAILVASLLRCRRPCGDQGRGREGSPKNSSDPKDIRVIIPSYSRDVDDNGCRLRSRPDERFSEADADIKHVRFADLISEVIGGYSVRAGLDAPETFMAKIAPLDTDMRTLVLLDVLRGGFGRDGLHTFFFMRTAAHAPVIAGALKAARLEREHGEFRRAMALFGPTYPVDEEARSKYFSYSSLDTPMNDFDRRMMAVSRTFGSREAFAAAMVTFVERTPALWKRIEAQRAKLGEVARLRYLNQALVQRLAAARRLRCRHRGAAKRATDRAAYVVGDGVLQHRVLERRRIAPVLSQLLRRRRSRGLRSISRIGPRAPSGDL